MTESVNGARRAPTILRSIAPLFVLLALTSGTSYAQRYQETFGGPDPVGEEGNGVIEAANGDHIAAGVSHSQNLFSQVYVVRTDADGVPLWHYVYEFEGIDSSGASDIKELPNGDLVIVGWVWVGTSREALVMRMDATGIPIWVRTPHIISSPTLATSVVVTKIGNNTTTHPGDIALAGYTESNGVGSTYDGLLGRFDGNGNLIWLQHYHIPGQVDIRDDLLYGIDEESFSGTGDIVAVGTSSDPAAGIPGDVWVVRVDGNTGKINGGPQGSMLVDGGNEDVGYSIQELHFGSNPGDFVVTGSTTSRPLPSSSKEAFVLEIHPDPCDLTPISAVTVFGDDDSGQDWGTAIREITSVNAGTVGDLVVGGITDRASNGADGFMQGIQGGTLALAGQYLYYGNQGDDEIRSIAETQNAPNSQGFVHTGVTTTSELLPSGNLRNLWLGKVDSQLFNSCYYETETFSDVSMTWLTTCVNPVQKDDVLVETRWGEEHPPFWDGYLACHESAKPMIPGNSPATALPAMVSLISSPARVRAGEPLTLGYALTVSGSVTITVADALGRVRYRKSTDRAAGESAEEIATTGWSAGTYLARISSGSASVTAKIVVLDR